MASMFGKYLNINKSLKKTRGYPTRIYTSAICHCGDQYLLFKISDSYRICPGDWEWLTCKVQFSNSSELYWTLIENSYHSLKLHTDLEGRAQRIYPLLKWIDDEFKFTYLLYPIFIEVPDKKFRLRSNKFSDYKWLRWSDISNFDRNNYLSDYLKHLQRWE